MSLSNCNKKDLKKFCIENLKGRESELIILLLNTKRLRLFLIQSLSEQIHNEIIDPEIYINFEKVIAKDINLNNLFLFEVYEKLIMKCNIKENIEKYNLKRSELENEIKNNPMAVKSMLENIELVPFLSKFNDFESKFNNFESKINDFDSKFNDFESKFNVIDFETKKIYLHKQIKRCYKGSCQIKINRKKILQESYDMVMSLPINDFKEKMLFISFARERNDDYKGKTKEWLELILKEALNPKNGLFMCNMNKTCLIPSLDSSVDYHKFIGRILGRMIIEKYNVDLKLDGSVFKYILGIKCNLEDLKYFDTELYEKLIWIKKNEVNVLNLTFSIDGINLKEEDILLTDLNKFEYIDLVVEYKLVKKIEKQLNALREGFFEIIDEKSFKIFNENELELLICGVPDINVDDWMYNSKYMGYNKYTNNAVWFWKAVRGFTYEEKKKLLEFCTGKSKVPYGGFSELMGKDGLQKFSIHKVPPGHYISANTSINQIHLPVQKSYGELRRNIIYAINKQNNN